MNSVERRAYRSRARRQALQWAFGICEHNHVDDECCPDFSCCRPELFEKSSEKRWDYYHKEFPDEDQVGGGR